MKIEKNDPTKNKNQLIRTNQITILKILRVGDTQVGFLFYFIFIEISFYTLHFS